MMDDSVPLNRANNTLIKQPFLGCLRVCNEWRVLYTLPPDVCAYAVFLSK